LSLSSNSKDRIKLTAILVILGLLFFWFVIIPILGPKKSGELMGNVQIIDINDKEKADTKTKDKENYGVKKQDGDKYYLVTYTNSSGYSCKESKFRLTKKQYNELVLGKAYWILVTYYENSSSKENTVKTIYVSDPMLR